MAVVSILNTRLSFVPVFSVRIIITKHHVRVQFRLSNQEKVRTSYMNGPSIDNANCAFSSGDLNIAMPKHRVPKDGFWFSSR